MLRLIRCLMLCLLAAPVLAAEPTPDCKAIRDSAARLTCYDNQGSYKEYNYYKSERTALEQRLADETAKLQRAEDDLRKLEAEERYSAQKIIEIKARGARRQASIQAEIDCIRRNPRNTKIACQRFH